MTIERNEVFELAYRFITETSENIFLTGKAGTGKTTFLKYLKENSTKNMVVAAPTGVAAINAGGVTLHSLFQLPFQPFLPTAANREELLKKLKYNKQRLNLLRKMEVLVIDEISMVRADVMDALDCILRSVRRNYDAPYGGIQLLCIGDLHQLPPVAQNHEWEILQNYYASPFFFSSLAIQEQQPVLIELNKIYRQKEQDFVDLLNSVRTNSMTEDDFETLHSRYNPTFVPFPEDKYITLTSHNRQADLINNSEIQKLLTAPKAYAAEIEDDFPESMYPADVSLVLKVGAQVMFLKNDAIEKKFFNGKIGVVTKLEDDKIFVLSDGKEIDVPKETWENKKYTLNKADGKLLQETVGGFTQFPLRLAWAITIHKSQGLTFDKVMIDAGSAFSSGQVYVALSRCTSLDGIVLLSKIASTAIYSNENVEKGQKELTVKGSLADRFAGARQVYTQQILEELFAFEDLYHDLAALKATIFHHKLKLNNGAIEWMEENFASFEAERINGAKFNRHINAMLKEDAVIETNTALQERLAAAAKHFVPKLEALLDQIKKHPLITEHKEVSEPINEMLNTVALSFYKTNYFIGYCTNPFTLLGYLQHKLNYAEPKYNISCYASGKQAPVNTNLPNEELYQSLKRWRDLICEDEGAPVFMVATHVMLVDICTYLPINKRYLMLISGFGKAKLDKYGEEIIDTVIDYCDRYNLTGNITPQKTTAKKAKATSNAPAKIDTKTSTYELYKAGKTIEEIAKERNFAIQTIEGHLAAFIEKGLIHIDNFVNEKDFTTIANALKTRGEKSLTEVKEQLPKASFGEIRMVEAAMKFEADKG
jgi:PIF1-like helicase/Helix-turn-helix domain/HRDC domain/Helicase